MRSPDLPGAPPGAASRRLSAGERTLLVGVGRASIEHGLRTGAPLPVDGTGVSPGLRTPTATFVTIRRSDGELRGCIGELEAQRPLVQSVAWNAWSAAFRDPRFDAVGWDELEDLVLHISLLGPLEPLPAGSEDELLRALAPGRDGLLIDDGLHRATFLPAVWASLADPERFLGELKRKAGLPASAWPLGLEAWRYSVEEIP
jgi:AmmeMemoRadiSam system protein A